MRRAQSEYLVPCCVFKEDHASQPELIAELSSTLGYFGLEECSDNGVVFFRKYPFAVSRK